MEQIPQIWPGTGMSQDYFNEYIGKGMILERGNLERVARSFRDRPIKRYEERFPATVYQDVVTLENQWRVQRLDEIAQEANARFSDVSRFTKDDFERTVTEVRCLIWDDAV
ncbi:MAG: hypothetical protein Q7R76_01520 [Candidatus Woesearchaeota archaeon]|nr:hypothetical protein [Candidatus Woesearchaeota archaeon]